MALPGWMSLKAKPALAASGLLPQLTRRSSQLAMPHSGRRMLQSSRALSIAGRRSPSMRMRGRALSRASVNAQALLSFAVDLQLLGEQARGFITTG